MRRSYRSSNGQNPCFHHGNVQKNPCCRPDRRSRRLQWPLPLLARLNPCSAWTAYWRQSRKQNEILSLRHCWRLRRQSEKTQPTFTNFLPRQQREARKSLSRMRDTISTLLSRVLARITPRMRRRSIMSGFPGGKGDCGRSRGSAGSLPESILLTLCSCCAARDGLLSRNCILPLSRAG